MTGQFFVTIVDAHDVDSTTLTSFTRQVSTYVCISKFSLVFHNRCGKRSPQVAVGSNDIARRCVYLHYFFVIGIALLERTLSRSACPYRILVHHCLCQGTLGVSVSPRYLTSPRLMQSLATPRTPRRGECVAKFSYFIRSFPAHVRDNTNVVGQRHRHLNIPRQMALICSVVQREQFSSCFVAGGTFGTHWTVDLTAPPASPGRDMPSGKVRRSASRWR